MPEVLGDRPVLGLSPAPTILPMPEVVPMNFSDRVFWVALTVLGTTAWIAPATTEWLVRSLFQGADWP